MGNTASNDGDRSGRRRHGVNVPAPAPQPQPEITSNRYVFAAATPYPSQYPGAQPPPPTPFYNYGYYPPPPPAMPVPYDPQVGGRYPCGPQPAPYVEHQKAVTIRNDVNLKKETLRMEPDEENPGRFLVAFTFDATVSGSISVMFFAKEGEECALMPTKETLLPPVTVDFEKGLGQKFRQPCGSGIDFTMFEDKELLEAGESDVFPLAVKAEASLSGQNELNKNQTSGSTNSQITQAIFENKGVYQVRVVKQFLWVNRMRYELQEIYGIGNSADGEADANDPGKECVICLSEPRDTTVLPCRHMCMCSGCAKVLRFQTNRCPICRQPVERLLEIKVNNGPEE